MVYSLNYPWMTFDLGNTVKLRFLIYDTYYLRTSFLKLVFTHASIEHQKYVFTDLQQYLHNICTNIKVKVENICLYTLKWHGTLYSIYFVQGIVLLLQ